MTPNNFAFAIRSLRAVEKATNKDMTERALEVFRLRQQTIEAGGDSPERKSALVMKAHGQWELFMQRQFPANG